MFQKRNKDRKGVDGGRIDVVPHYILISLTLFRSLLSPVDKMHQLEKEGEENRREMAD